MRIHIKNFKKLMKQLNKLKNHIIKLVNYEYLFIRKS